MDLLQWILTWLMVGLCGVIICRVVGGKISLLWWVRGIGLGFLTFLFGLLVLTSEGWRYLDKLKEWMRDTEL